MLTKRICAGLSVGAFFAFLLALSNGPLLVLVLILLTAASQREFYGLASRSGYRVYKTFGTLCGVIWLACEYLFQAPFAAAEARVSAYPLWSPILLAGVFFAILLRTLFDRGVEKAFESVAVTFLGFLYLPLTISYYIRLAQWDGILRLGTTRASVFLAFFLSVVIKMSDTGAFAVGTSFARTVGTHPMFPRISPKKSWEGLAGGIATGCLTGALLAFLAHRFEWGPDGVFWASPGGRTVLTFTRSLVVSAVLVVVGVFGDLIESMLKRASDIKDSARVLPGVGGLLDIVDSLVFGPVTFYFAIQLCAALRG